MKAAISTKKHLFLTIATLGTNLVFGNALAQDIPQPRHKPLTEHVKLDTAGTMPPSIAVPSPATHPRPVKEFTISRPGDLEMSCDQLFHEARAMSMVIDQTDNIKDDSEMQSRGIAAAGALGSFLVGTVTGGIGLAVGGFLLDQNVDAREHSADEIQDIAEQRRTLMMGIYTAQSCEGDIYAMIKPRPPRKTALQSLAQINTGAGDITPDERSLPHGGYNE